MVIELMKKDAPNVISKVEFTPNPEVFVLLV